MSVGQDRRKRGVLDAFSHKDRTGIWCRVWVYGAGEAKGRQTRDKGVFKIARQLGGIVWRLADRRVSHQFAQLLHEFARVE